MVGSVSASSSDGGHDAALLEYLMNADLYEDQAAACCSTLLVRGTEVDGLFIKNSTLFNGRPMFVNEDGGKNKNLKNQHCSIISKNTFILVNN